MRGLSNLKGQIGRAVLFGSFKTVASGDPTWFRGTGFTVTRVNTGRYLVTLTDPVDAIDSIVAMVAVETAGTALFCDVDEDSITTQAFELNVEDDADTLTDDAGSRVMFFVGVRNTKVSYGEGT